MPTKSLGIPSWWMAAFGALLVGLSATVGPVVLWHIDDDIQEQIQEIGKLESKRQLYWDEHGRTDERVARATQLLAVANQLDGTLQQLVLNRASEDATAAISNSIGIFNMISSTPVDATSCIEDLPDTEELSVMLQAASVDRLSCLEWFASIEAGDVNSFAAVANFRTGLIGVMSEGMRQLNERILQRQTSIAELRSSRNIWQGVEIFVALLGLLMLVLKDVPIWKRKNPPQSKGGETGQGGTG